MFHEILESSWSYQEMVQKGVDQGLEIGKRQGLEKGIRKGREEGELQTLRSVLLRFVEKHFPTLSSLAQQQSAQLTQPDRLNAIVDQLLDARTEEQARQILTDNPPIPPKS